MPSPFPGMDPYLEASGRWPDFHASFLTYWRDAIADLLPDNYEARLNERVQLVSPPEQVHRSMEPDVAVTRRTASSSEITAPPGAAILEPVTLPFPTLYVDPPRETYLEVFHLPERTLVAVLELLSPSNKVEPGRSDYYAKRNALLLHRIHQIELDLLIRGRRLPTGGRLPPGDYYAMVTRGDGQNRIHVYAWSLRQPLPTLPIPLLPPDADIWFDLGAVFATTYERGRYARALDYAKAPELPMSDADREWVVERLKTARG